MPSDPTMSNFSIGTLARTNAFRLTLLFSGLLIGSVLVLFGLIYWNTEIFLSERFNESLQQEAQEFVRAPPDQLAMEVDNLVASDPLNDWQAGLFSADRQPLAGNIKKIPERVEFDGLIHDFSTRMDGINGHSSLDLRGIGMAFPDGRFLLLVNRAHEVHEVREVITRAMGWGLAASVALALLGGLTFSFLSLRRIEAMHRSAAAIMNGDLSRRLPVDGSGDDFDKLANIVNAMLAEIERLIGDVKAAGDNIAHDLRTPLTRLRTRLEGALRRGGTVEDHRAAMEDAITETDQILATFRALLRISEVEAGARRAGFGEVDLVGLMHSAAELFEPLAAERGLTFTVSIASAAAVRGDPDLLFEAVANLLDNAVKFTPAGGEVTLTLSADGEIAVADSGPGLPADLKEALLQRFTRGDKARHLPGNGLGLSLVAAVTRLHGFGLSMNNTDPGCRAIIAAKVG